jgi:hypothetical protein
VHEPFVLYTQDIYKAEFLNTRTKTTWKLLKPASSTTFSAMRLGSSFKVAMLVQIPEATRCQSSIFESGMILKIIAGINTPITIKIVPLFASTLKQS